LDINLTLIIQMIVFAAFVLFTMRFVWPPLEKAMEERQNKIADGLSAAERGRRELELAQHRIKDELKQAKHQAAEIIDKATKRAALLIEESKEEAKREAQIILKQGQEQLQQEKLHAKSELLKEVGQLAIAGAEKILMQRIDNATNKRLNDNIIEEI
jgi:F-type H+-transporting ATPase subunit b